MNRSSATKKGCMGNSVLIVEDDMQNYQLVANVVILSGGDVLHARSGDEGLELATSHVPCLIVLDMRLPGLDGWQLARILKSDPAVSHIPIVAISVQVYPDDEDRALEAGCDVYLPKPFSVKRLREYLAEYVPC